MDGRITLYYNPRCSKCRGALELLEQRELDFEVVEYLEKPLDRASLLGLIEMVGGDPADLVRSGDAKFKEAGISPVCLGSSEEVAGLLVEHPEFMQRPVVVVGTRAVIARPPDKLLDLL